MDIRTEMYWIRLERASTDSWLEAHVRVLMPRDNDPQRLTRIKNYLDSIVCGLYAGWELVTYSPVSHIQMEQDNAE